MLNSEIKADIMAAYNNKAYERDSLTIEEWKFENRQHFLDRLLESSKQTILEIGAGPGRDSLFFQEQGLNVVCTDLSPEMINLCKMKGLESHVMAFDELSFPNETFDAVWALNCLLHVPKQELEGILLGIKRVLKNDGLFYMGVYGGENSEGVWEEDFYEPKRFFSFYTKLELENILKKHFNIITFDEIAPEVIGSGELSFQSIVLKKEL